MKFSEPLESQRLSFLLEMATSREAAMWKVYVPKNPTNQDTDISPAQRDEVVRWLTDLHRRLQLYPGTLSLGISTLDRFLAIVKARPKYLRCIAISCYFLAAKTTEEDERIPALRHLAKNSCCGCSPSEILRMERIVLDKLSWDLHTATPLDFLHIMDSSQLIRCRELVARRLSPHQAPTPPNTVYIYQPQKHSLAPCARGIPWRQPPPPAPRDPRSTSRPEGAPTRPRPLIRPGWKPASAKRKVEEMEVDEFYDGIKRLYNEDSAPEGAGAEGGGLVCGAAAAWPEGSPSPCPPLRPVSVA
ncbi:cyclin-I isoform X2 [Lepisosteus oculatus]|uniref:cyclin-I isoform X2 n=1 Tax=Lepisosteus oculatus TaxID=7918 RepID=UPI00371B1B62